MKIFEIVEPKVVNRARPRPFDEKYLSTRYKNQQKKYNELKPNTGLYSQGRTNINDPFMFTKIANRPVDLDRDAYYNYVKEIEPYMGSNPYFPRVYVTKIDRDSTGRTIPKYQIEKLFSYDDLGEDKIEILTQIRDRIFSSAESLDPTEIFYMIQECLYHGNFSRIKDKSLAKALELIKNLKERKRLHYDLHLGNFLFRRGPTGVQLVIADPLT